MYTIQESVNASQPLGSVEGHLEEHHVCQFTFESHTMCTQVGFETEGTAIYDTMQFVKNEVSLPLSLCSP